MNKQYTTVQARFGPETRFEVRPSPPAGFRALAEAELEGLKGRLLRERLADSAGNELSARLRLAANDAAALAWATTFPLLVFPVLFEEKAGKAALEAARQAGVRERSRELMAA